MMGIRTLQNFLIPFIFATTFGASDAEKKLVCYFNSASIFLRLSYGKFDILSHVNPSLCTHLIYYSAIISGNLTIYQYFSIVDRPDNKSSNLTSLGKFNSFRSENLKTLISIREQNKTSQEFSQIAVNETSRRNFADAAANFCSEQKFDGLDFYWVYPRQRGDDASADKNNIVLLLRELKDRFDKDGLILSAAVEATENPARELYDVKAMGEIVDFVNVMAFDMHHWQERKTGLNAPLFPRSWEKGVERQKNVNASITFWLSEGLPAEKLILGIPMYGRSFRLDSPENHTVGSPALEIPTSGLYSNLVGFAEYIGICELLMSNAAWTVKFDEEQRCPYAFMADQWVGYDNERSVGEKADLVKQYNLGGAMVSTIDTDDFRGICGPKYPLLSALNRALRGAPDATTPATQNKTIAKKSGRPRRVMTTKSLILKPSGRCDLTCKKPGFVRDGDNCSKFYQCVSYRSTFQRFEFTCPVGLVFDLKINNCNWSQNVNCSTCA